MSDRVALAEVVKIDDKRLTEVKHLGNIMPEIINLRSRYWKMG